MRMSLWTLRIGIVLAITGLALLSPLGDLLPLNFWPSLTSLFATGPAPAEQVFYRVVPCEQSRAVEFVLIGSGLASVGASLYVRLRK